MVGAPEQRALRYGDWLRHFIVFTTIPLPGDLGVIRLNAHENCSNSRRFTICMRMRPYLSAQADHQCSAKLALSIRDAQRLSTFS